MVLSNLIVPQKITNFIIKNFLFKIQTNVPGWHMFCVKSVLLWLFIAILNFERAAAYELNTETTSDNESKFVPNEFYYKYPSQPIANPNVTIAAMFKLTGDQIEDDIESAANLMTLICEVDRYNSGIGKFNVEGIFNVLVIPTENKDEFSAWSLTRQVLSQNLYYNNTTRTFGAIQDTPINVIIRLGTLREISADTSIISGYPLPAINFVSEKLFYSKSNEPLIIAAPSGYSGSVSVSQTSPLIIANYLTQVLLHYNWSLVGAVFSSDIIGFYGQNSIQDLVYTYFRNNLTFSCLQVVENYGGVAYENDLKDFSTCISSSNQIRAVIVWMKSEDSIRATEEILKNIGYSMNLVFIYLDLTDEAATIFAPISSMFLRSIPNYNTPGTEFQCAQFSKQKMIEILGKEKVDLVSRKFGNCIITDPSLPLCDEIRSDNDTNCTCISDEIVKYFIISVFIILSRLLVLFFIFR